MDELKTEFTAFVGEEVHVDENELYHVVNFNPKSSVNELIRNDPKAFCERIRDGVKDIDGITGDSALMLSGYKIITDEIRKSGGMPIFPHPYWDYANSYNCPTDVAQEVLKRGYCDAFEVLGGLNVENNNIQTALYNELRAEGVKVAVVGSTDCHKTQLRYVDLSDVGKTVVFAKNPDNIPDSIRDLYSVAVETRRSEDERVYGPLRLVKYTQFLLKNYFPVHNILCNASGTLMCEYFNGNKYLKEAIEKAEERIAAYKNDFFGKRD